MKVIGAAHSITPRPGTVRRLNGEQGSVMVPSHYPLTARCVECGRPIRVDNHMFDNWCHLDENRPA